MSLVIGRLRPIMPAMWLLAPAFVLVDLLLAVLGFEIVAVLVTGGGEFTLGGQRISARSIVNPLIVFIVLAATRFSWTDRPFTFHRGLSRSSINRTAASSIESAWLRFTSLDGVRAHRWVLAIAAASLVVKMANIAWYQGFYSGDDVEIHEMTLGLIFHRDWPVWNLRSPIFPVGFIYPVQWTLAQLGVSETTPLVLAARSVVALFSTANVVLLWSVTRRQWHSTPVAVIAAALLAFSGLHVQFGSSELPRTVATTFVLAAAWLLQERDSRRELALAALAGVLLGLAGAIRFSEAMFLAPAALTLVLKRRWGAGVLLLATGAAAYVGLICLGDWLYWGSPFYSGRHIIQFTLVDRLSSRGYEPWHYYLSHLLVWSNPFAVAAVVFAVANGGRTYAGLWVGVPLLLLSLLPHKEPRYLLPILPFWSAVAALGAWRALEGIRLSRRKELLSAAFLALLAIGLLVEADRFRFRRSAEAVRAMEFVASQHPKAVAFEESWTGGGWLYVKDAKLVDLQLRDAPEPEKTVAAVCQDRVIDWVVLRSRRGSDGSVATLTGCGFTRVASGQVPPAYIALKRSSGP
jgi:hypothetical protein